MGPDVFKVALVLVSICALVYAFRALLAYRRSPRLKQAAADSTDTKSPIRLFLALLAGCSIGVLLAIGTPRVVGGVISLFLIVMIGQRAQKRT